MSNPRERLLAAFRFEKPADRLCVMEWAKWWELTVARWRSEGLPAALSGDRIGGYLGLDSARRIRYRIAQNAFPSAEFGQPLIRDLAEYERVKDVLFDRDQVRKNLTALEEMRALQASEGMITWVGIDGFFWLGRELLGIEEHLYAFYDEPDLLKRINGDLLRYNLFLLEQTFKVLKPDFVTLAEDMSYNHGPMISKALYDEFIKPYYRELLPFISRQGAYAFVDTDGDVLKLLDWLVEDGVQGILPLERQAGVDVNEIRRLYPRLLMMGGFDKTIMHLGERRMRQEFERILPAMRSGGYVPTVDHQTPPDVSLDQYRAYVRLATEYAELASGGTEVRHGPATGD